MFALQLRAALSRQASLAAALLLRGPPTRPRRSRPYFIEEDGHPILVGRGVCLHMLVVRDFRRLFELGREHDGLIDHSPQRTEVVPDVVDAGRLKLGLPEAGRLKLGLRSLNLLQLDQKRLQRLCLSATGRAA